MFLGLINNKKFFPNEYVKSIYDIDFLSYFQKGIRVILTDLDNTLASYKERTPSQKLMDKVKGLKEMGFEIVIVSNNSSKKRVSYFSKILDVKYTYFSLKPLKFGYKRALKKTLLKYEKSEVLTIGDQLLTDILSSNRMKITSILVKAVDRKTEVFSTSINRRIERHILKVLKKKEPEQYALKLKEYGAEHYGI